MNEETKKCKHCQTDIPKKAKVCPNCKKKQSGLLKWIIIVIIVLIIVGSFSNEDDGYVTKVNTSEKTQETSNKQSETEISNEETSKEKETVFTIGDTAEYKDVQISLLSYEESTGNDWSTPADGKIFVFAEFEIVNNSKDEISISSMLSFESYCDDYKLDYSSNALMAISTEDSKQLDGSIAPGKKMKGVLGLEVPSDWKNIEIYYKDNAWLDSNFSFVIEK